MRTDYTVYYFGLNDWHDVYDYYNLDVRGIVNIIKKKADELGATAFIIHTKEDDQPLCLYKKRCGKWDREWGIQA